jgi:hypothetical protein
MFTRKRENKMLDKEFKYYTDNQEELVKNYNGKFLVIKDKKIEGAYNSQLEAYTEAKKKFEVGTFLIQRCSSGSINYTHSFHSRVTFQ